MMYEGLINYLRNESLSHIMAKEKTNFYTALANTIEKLEKELEQVKAEREAVLNDLKKYAACKACANFEHCFIEYHFKPCEHAKFWQWRGIQGGKGNE